MRSFIRRMSGMLGSTLPFSLVKNPAGNSYVFPFYHIVSDEPCPHTRYLYPVCSVDRFRKDIDFLLRNYRPLTFSQVVEYAAGGAKKTVKPGFYLTFDDGLREIADVVVPILLKKGIEAAFFINPAFVDNHSLFRRHKVSLLIDSINRQKDEEALKTTAGILNCRPVEVIKKILSLGDHEYAIIDSLAVILHIDFGRFLINNKPYLGLHRLRELQEKGFVIGSHSFDHTLFSGLTLFQMKEQVMKSMNWLSQNLSVRQRVFAFPFTDDRIPSGFFQWMYDDAKIEVSFGTAGLKHELFRKHIQRIPMEQWGFDSARQILGEEYVVYIIRSIFGKNKITGR
jgi:peptidoglycan/xylan/chitin deacetylase (PgdA/CDA1 family)